MFDSFSDNEYKKIKQILPVYEDALKQLMTNIQLSFSSNEQFQKNNPVEHVKTRIKSPENIANKLIRLDLDVTAENAKKVLTDIAGIRIICSYAKDIFFLVDLLKTLPETQVLIEKDYVSNPKKSGYRCYHVIMEVPVFTSGKKELVPVEVQLRTAAMDFWATLEHKVRYKYNEFIPKHLSDELSICAEKIAELDNRMFLIHDIISLINQDPVTTKNPIAQLE